MTEATCALCDETTSYPVGGSWAFPWVATPRGGFVARVCPGCAASDYYLERLRAIAEAREGEKTGAKGRRKR